MGGGELPEEWGSLGYWESHDLAIPVAEAHTYLDMGTSFSHRHALEHSHGYSPTAIHMSTCL